MHWSLPATADDERDIELRIGRRLRAESDAFKQAYYAARDAGEDPATVEALRQSVWHSVGKAAQIERLRRRLR